LWEAASGKLLHTLGHDEEVRSIAFDPAGRILASGGSAIKLWDALTGQALKTLDVQYLQIWGLVFNPSAEAALAVGGTAQRIEFWEVHSGKNLRTLDQESAITNLAFDPTGRILASSHLGGKIRLSAALNGELLNTLEGHEQFVWGATFDPRGEVLASGGQDKTIKLWEMPGGRLLRTLERHSDSVQAVAFLDGGRFLVSEAADEIVIWSCSTWAPLTGIPNKHTGNWVLPLACHPEHLWVAAPVQGNQIHIWELDLEQLLSREGTSSLPRAVFYTTGKVVLVGDHSVGKSGLAYRMVHGHFKEQASTHGQQFWVFPDLAKKRADGTECEAILWDLAGQPDYRLVHALFVDDADLALVLFDSSDIRDPLHGVGFWLQQLRSGRGDYPIILVGAQADRGTSTLTEDELKEFCRRNRIAGPVRTSALSGEGVAELIERMRALIPWDDKPATVTTKTFKRIKDYVLGLKEAESGRRVIVDPGELRKRLEATDAEWQFTDDEMLTAVGHLENYGYVKRLRTSKGERRILLAPDLLNNLASSCVLEARRNQKGLGSLEEKRLLAGGYAFPELARLSEEDRAVLLDSATLLFLEHNVCFRETDPLRIESYLVFPELINLKKPVEEGIPAQDGVAYTVNGATENVFASLVVLLGYTHTFTRTNQWQNHARYEVGDGLVCGFRQDAERDGELDFVLYFGPTVPKPIRTLFQGLFESFLARRNLRVVRFEPVVCTKCGHALERSVVRQRTREGKTFTFCNECGERLALPKEEPIQLTQEEQAKVGIQHRTANERTRFEQALFRVQAYVTEQKIKPPECFISYAWGHKERERWVERSLAMDLQKAGVAVVLDRWENAVGTSLSRFVERIEKADRIVVVWTPEYRRKYENKDTAAGYVVAAEVDLISNRLLGTEEQKRSVLPVLLVGEKTESFPPLLHSRNYADFRDEPGYFLAAFDLVLSLYGLKPNHPAVADLRETLAGGRFVV
jgi:small GTP-binding protein